VTRPELLDVAQVDAALAADGSAWHRDGDKLHVEYGFSSFLAAVDFVVGLASIAEGLNHHPDIDVRYNKVRLEVWTHDRGGLTALDVALARQADALVAESSTR
jgi:4a-hydroxytetrahydrobiopterin dehydratase